MNELPNRDVVIFTEAVDLPSDERAAYLERACGGDARLRQQVEALLQTHDHVGDFLEASPQKASVESRGKSSANESPGCRIGRYKLLQQIGEGGCPRPSWSLSMLAATWPIRAWNRVAKGEADLHRTGLGVRHLGVTRPRSTSQSSMACRPRRLESKRSENR